jgi:hypothetical protein
MSAETPHTAMARVASRNGAPTMAPIATGPACLPSVMMAMTGISDSGIAVATAASTLPTAPWPRPRRRPAHSTALVNTAAPTTITAKLATSSTPATMNLRSRAPRRAGACTD